MLYPKNIITNLFIAIITVPLLSGCMYVYDYNYEGFSAYTGPVSPFKGESKTTIKGICTYSAYSDKKKTILEFPPFSLLLYDKVYLNINQEITQTEVLSAIKNIPYKKIYPDESGYLQGIGDAPKGKTVLLDVYKSVDEGFSYSVASFIFNNNKLIYWSVNSVPMPGNQDSKEYVQIGKYKSNKFYPMPITVLQLKEIFGKPKEVISRPNIF